MPAPGPAPVTELDARYSEPEAAATGWEDALAELATAELSWISTVRRDGRPHVTPLITVVHDGTVYFCTGPEEQKGRNLAANPSVAMTTGRNDLHGGLDLVVEGTAERVTDDDLLLGELVFVRAEFHHVLENRRVGVEIIEPVLREVAGHHIAAEFAHAALNRDDVGENLEQR